MTEPSNSDSQFLQRVVYGLLTLVGLIVISSVIAVFYFGSASFAANKAEATPVVITVLVTSESQPTMTERATEVIPTPSPGVTASAIPPTPQATLPIARTLGPAAPVATLFSVEPEQVANGIMDMASTNGYSLTNLRVTLDGDDYLTAGGRLDMTIGSQQIAGDVKIGGVLAVDEDGLDFQLESLNVAGQDATSTDYAPYVEQLVDFWLDAMLLEHQVTSIQDFDIQDGKLVINALIEGD